MLQSLRSLKKRLINPVVFNDLTRIQPISSLFGFDRGTPIDRYYIDSFLSDNKSSIRGVVLELADSSYSRRFGEDRVTSYEVLHATTDNPKATIVGDLTRKETLPPSKFDCFICTQTLNVIFDVWGAIEGAHHLLRPGGVVLCTVAGICQISRYDMDRWGDYWRFTTASVEKLFESVFKEGVEVGSYGNVVAATALLQGIAVEDLPDPSVLNRHDPDYQLVITVRATKAAS